METVLWIAVAAAIDAAAVAAWLFLISRFDKNRKIKNQGRLLFQFYFFGMASALVSFIVYHPFSWLVTPLYGGRSGVNMFFYHLLVVGPNEEIAKFLVFAVIATKLKSIKELKDGILQACSVALGFAAVENFKYGWYYGLDILFARFYHATVGHLLYAILWGSVFAVVYLHMKEEPKKRKIGYIAASLVPAALFHGISNFFVSLGFNGAYRTLDILVGIIGLSIFLYLRKHSPYRDLPLTQYKKALPHIETALQRNPDDYELNYRAGKYTLYGKQYKRSSGHLKVCKRQRPKNPAVSLLYGTALLGAGDHVTGQKILKKRFTDLTEQQEKLIKKKLGEFRLTSTLERQVYSAVGISEPEHAYRIEKVRKPRYVNRSGRSYKSVLEEKTADLRTLIAESEGKAG